jgi:hypothetical protein
MKYKAAHEFVSGDVFVAYVNNGPLLTYLNASEIRHDKHEHVFTFLSSAEHNKLGWREIIVLESLWHKPTVIFFDEKLTYETI